MSKQMIANLLVAVQFILFGLIAWFVFTTPSTTDTVLKVLGAGVMVGGLAFLWIAIMTHQQTNQVMPKITPIPNESVNLVNDGLYEHIRHPIYTGVLCCAFGVAIAHGGLVVWILAFALLILFTVKSIFEETMLSATYPTYADYMKQTGRFLPLWVDLAGKSRPQT